VYQLVQRAPGQLEQLRPLAQPPRQVAEAVRVGLRPELRAELVAEQVDRFVGGHLVDLDRLRLEGEGEIEAPGREQPGAALAATEERVEVGLPPDVVDDDQGGLVLQPRGELLRCLLDASEAGLLAGQGLVERRQAAEDVGRLLAQLDPEDAVGKGVDDVVIVAQGLGQRGLAEAPGALQGRGDGDWVLARFVEQ